MSKSRGSTASNELIEAVRRCAGRRMSYAATADELTTRAHPLTRNAVAGIARKNKIEFNAPANNSASIAARAKSKPGPRRSKRQYDPVPSQVVGTTKSVRGMANFSTVGNARHPKPPGPLCSWNGCTCAAAEGDMFCNGHARKALVG